MCSVGFEHARVQYMQILNLSTHVYSRATGARVQSTGRNRRCEGSCRLPARVFLGGAAVVGAGGAGPGLLGNPSLYNQTILLARSLYTRCESGRVISILPA